MKKSSYVDYTKSEFFSGEEESLRKEIEASKKQTSNIIWIQEFSKKVVVITFGLYIIGEIAMFLFLWYSMKMGMGVGIDTFYSELNQTFRDVIGGYIIKSAVENSFKIAGNYLVGINNAKMKILESKLKKENKIDGNTSDEEDAYIVEE